MVDLLIVGGGIAGVTAAIYAKNKGLTVKLFENKMIGGNLNYINDITNYPGFSKITGSEFSFNLLDQIKKNNIDVCNENIVSVNNDNNIIKIVTDNNFYEGKNLLIATGRSPRLLNLPNENKFYLNGISTCAICDGPLYRDLDVCVIGGGNASLHEALYLSNICHEVTIIHRRNEFTADQVYIDQIKNKDNIKTIMNEEVIDYLGDERLTGLKLKNQEIKTDGVFLAIGSVPNTKLFSELNLAFNNGYLIVDKNMRTNIPNIYACGDCVYKEVYQLVTASSDAIIAVLNMNN